RSSKNSPSRVRTWKSICFSMGSASSASFPPAPTLKSSATSNWDVRIKPLVRASGRGSGGHEIMPLQQVTVDDFLHITKHLRRMIVSCKNTACILGLRPHRLTTSQKWNSLQRHLLHAIGA